jgi:hypothetical protein
MWTASKVVPSYDRLAAFAVGALLLVAPGIAQGGVYPVNDCVSTKMRNAGEYCSAVLGAWSLWDTSQDDAKRDATLAKAQEKLGERWAQAEEKSFMKDVDCAETTLSATELGELVGSAAAQIVAEVNGGLDLGDKSDARCGSDLLKIASDKCDAFLSAESRFVLVPANDPGGAKRDMDQTHASDKFSDAWDKIFRKGCNSTATEAGIEGLVDGLSDDVVTNTTISPNVDDSQFTTISPVGPVSYEGRSLEPTCMNGSDYHFFVKRGSVNNLLMYYQGGGACWEQLTCSIPVCDSSVSVVGDNPNNFSSGFADLNNPDNPFKDWNIVFVPYCSCDVHFGDAAQDYDNFDPNNPLHVEHRGYQNSRVAEKWAREHFVNPDAVFVTGSSAGAYGAWFNAPLHERVWPASKFAVLADAGNGVITQDFRDNYFPNWNFDANLPKDIPGLKTVFDSGGGIPEYTEIVANYFANTTWAHYSTAFDGSSGGQTGFYNIMLNDNDPLAALTWWNGSCAFNDKMTMQAMDTAAALPSNYRYYIGTGSRHTMWGSNKVYTDTTGGVPTIVDWVDAMLGSSPPMSTDPGWTNVECTNCGLLLPGDPRPNPLQPPFQMSGPDVVVVCP